MDVQNLEKTQRNKIIKELCKQGAGFGQLLSIICSLLHAKIQRKIVKRDILHRSISSERDILHK